MVGGPLSQVKGQVWIEEAWLVYRRCCFCCSELSFLLGYGEAQFARLKTVHDVAQTDCFHLRLCLEGQGADV